MCLLHSQRLGVTFVSLLAHLWHAPIPSVLFKIIRHLSTLNFSLSVFHNWRRPVLRALSTCYQVYIEFSGWNTES